MRKDHSSEGAIFYQPGIATPGSKLQFFFRIGIIFIKILPKAGGHDNSNLCDMI